jgi:ATP-dependent exoDNAse (exonuclease V) beta subunit
MTLCEELFIWIDQGLDPNQGLTFGDIEYLVALGLENADDLARIQKTYSYFIVDEFQDTSALQFKIIQSLIGNDYQKLFCVGDAKQAIYGFRGGELSVFKDCALLVPQLRSLANNYRSQPEIIHFNNSLFSTVLPLGQGFEGHDAFSVDAEDQNVPGELSLSDSAGSIEILSAVLERDLEVEDKFKNEHINRIEASLLSDSILKERSLDPKNVCTILYSKLKPSMDLIRFLMEKRPMTAPCLEICQEVSNGILICLKEIKDPRLFISLKMSSLNTKVSQNQNDCFMSLVLAPRKNSFG